MGNAVAGSERVGVRIVDAENSVRGLLLEPFSDVTLVCPGCGGQLGGSERPVHERPIEAEPVAEVQGEEIPRPAGCLKQAVDEGVALLGRVAHPLGTGVFSKTGALSRVPVCRRSIARNAGLKKP